VGEWGEDADAEAAEADEKRQKKKRRADTYKYLTLHYSLRDTYIPTTEWSRRQRETETDRTEPKAINMYSIV